MRPGSIVDQDLNVQSTMEVQTTEFTGTVFAQI